MQVLCKQSQDVGCGSHAAIVVGMKWGEPTPFGQREGTVLFVQGMGGSRAGEGEDSSSWRSLFPKQLEAWRSAYSGKLRGSGGSGSQQHSQRAQQGSLTSQGSADLGSLSAEASLTQDVSPLSLA